jgi:O-acetyl-ADP-ribose deacetylase (regulator of RNase III)
LLLAEERGCQGIAFPAISCGVYGYPIEEGARVAVQVAIDWLRNPERQISSIRFVLFDGTTFAAFERALENEV